MDHRHDRRRPWQDPPQTACLATIRMTGPRHPHAERGNMHGTIDAERPEISRAESALCAGLVRRWSTLYLLSVIVIPFASWPDGGQVLMDVRVATWLSLP